MKILNRISGNASGQLNIQNPLWMRLAAIGSGTVVLACAALGALSWYKQSAMIDRMIETELMKAGGAIFDDLEAQSRNLIAVANTIAQEPGIGDLVVAGARDELIRRYANAMPALKSEASIQMLTFDKAPGIAVARVHDTGAFGDDLTQRRRMIVEALAQGKAMVGIEPGRTHALSSFATVPLLTSSGFAGVVDVGTALTDSYFERLKKAHNVDLAIQIDQGERFETQNATFAAKTFLTTAETRAAIDGHKLRKIVDDGGKTLAIAAFPLKDFSGRDIGVLELADDVSAIIGEGRATLWATIIGSAAIAVLSLVLFVTFAISLSRPITNLTLSMNRLARGDLDTDVDPGRSDEIGAMAAAVQVFKDNALALKQASLERRHMEAVSDAERRENEAERQKLAYEQEHVVQALADGLERLSGGDLTTQIEAAFASDYKKLRDDFNVAVGQLRQTMAVIADTTREIRLGTGEIAQASDDMARRTEQQAASLEQTAAATGEITSKVQSTAATAKQLSDIVGQTRSSAEQSGTIVKDAVMAMSEIENSSRQIGSIISVIDEIAFQTNLLALNAGVEAARAGEAGRGFAVVASEVRALAQRSAEAAKEIKGLISMSMTQVDHGVSLVGMTGEALERIVTQIAGLNGFVLAISTDANEQAAGLHQVNTAVSHMDQMTQQNAAMVEQSTLAAHKLADRAGYLDRLVGGFKLGGGVADIGARKEYSPQSNRGKMRA
jgi:methyl-accepting chemotaxis protein